MRGGREVWAHVLMNGKPTAAAFECKNVAGHDKNGPCIAYTPAGSQTRILDSCSDDVGMICT